MATLRPAAIAGSFYPTDAATLQDAINGFLQHANSDKAAPGRHPPKAIIAPHAGYRFSGQCAGYGYQMWHECRAQVRRVVVFGPAHHVGVLGLAMSSADYWQTPLGAVPIDRTASDFWLQQDHINTHDAAHAQEHSLEIHLPFLQTLFADYQLLPFLVGQNASPMIADIVNHYRDDPTTVIVISSDLSHFHDDAFARSFDGETASMIERGAFDQLNGKRACGHIGIAGLLQTGQDLPQRVHMCNSGDAMPQTRDRVVGYGTWRFGALSTLSHGAKQ